MTGSPAGGTFSGTGVSGNDFDPASAGPGTFDIIYAYTDVNGCSNSDTVTVVVDPCTGIGNIETLQVNIVPNPNDGHFIITYPSFSKGSRYEIMNTQGKVVFSKTAESATETIDAGNLSAGLYIFKVIRENKSYTFKLAITR
jgi:hypothetical protein